MVIQVTLFLIVVVAANYLSCTNHKRFDLTERKEFSLSDFSKKCLRSEKFQQRKVPVKVTALIRRTSPHYSRVYHLLDEYQRQSENAIALELVDPLRQTDRTLEIEARLRLKYTEDMIIVDASEPVSQEDSDSNKTTDTNAVATSSGDSKQSATTNQELNSTHVRAIRISSLYLQDQNRNIVAWQDEDMITSSILAAIEGKPRKIYLAADKTNLNAHAGQPAWKNLSNLLLEQNIHLIPLRLAEIQSIPEDAQAVALIGPSYDLDEREIKLLQNYWNQQQSALLVTLDPNAKLDNLRIFLRSYGVTPRKDRIVTTREGQTLSNVATVFSRGAEINQDLGGKSTVFDGPSCSLEIRENDDQLLNRRIQPIALAKAATGWWGETRFQEKNAQYDIEEDVAPPIHIAAAVLRGQATSDETSNLVSKLVVIGNTTFLDTSKTRPEQADFVNSCVNWLIGREELIGIGPKKLHRHKITLLDAHNSFITKVLLIFLPAASLLTSLIVWNMRRA